MKAGWNLRGKRELLPYRLKAQDWDKILSSRTLVEDLDDVIVKAYFDEKAADELFASRSFIRLLGEDERWFKRVMTEGKFFEIFWKQKKLEQVNSMTGDSYLAYSKKHNCVVVGVGNSIYCYSTDGSAGDVIGTVSTSIRAVAASDEYIWAWHRNYDGSIRKLATFNFSGAMLNEVSLSSSTQLVAGKQYLWSVPYYSTYTLGVRYTFDLSESVTITERMSAGYPAPEGGRLIYTYNDSTLTPQYGLTDYPQTTTIDLGGWGTSVYVDKDGNIFMNVGANVRKYNNAFELVWETAVTGAKTAVLIGRMIMFSCYINGAYTHTIVAPDGTVVVTEAMSDIALPTYASFSPTAFLFTPDGYIWLRFGSVLGVYKLSFPGGDFKSTLNLTPYAPYWDY